MSSYTPTEGTETGDIAKLAAAATAVQRADHDSAPFVVAPPGWTLVDVERHLMEPVRKRGTTDVRDAASFLALVEAYRADGFTRLYRTIEPPRFEAIFNDHGDDDGSPGWGDHRAVYTCPLSPEWQTWMGGNKKAMAQTDFATFVEDNLPDIVEPKSAEMLEVSRTLQATRKVAFASGVRLDNGEQQLSYEETIEGRAGAKGQFRVPEVFRLGLPVFEGGPLYAVQARLRWRIADKGALSLWYDLERPHKIIEHAVSELTRQIEERSGMVTVNGVRRGSA